MSDHDAFAVPVISASRRGFLANGAILAALGLISGCCKEPPTGTTPGVSPAPGPSTPLAVIDVHCHVFNARDLPITGFIQHIYVPEAIEHAPGLAQVSNALSLLLAHMLQGPAPTATGELASLRRSGGTGTLSVAPDGARREDTRTDDDVLRDALRSALPLYLDDRPGSQTRIELFSQRLDRPEVRSAIEPSDEERERLLDILTGTPRPLGMDRRFTARRLSVESLVQGILKGPEEVVGVLKLGAFLGLPRAELVKRLTRLPVDGSGDQVRLFTPAVIDFTMWLTQTPLDQLEVSPLPDQVDVMGEIAALPGRSYGVHGFVPYCPWRQIRDEADPSRRARGMTPLEIVKYAVREQGFVGVKLYPVLGFYPYGNATRWNREVFPGDLRRLDPDGRRLDQALADLYDWCLAEDVAVMAHTSESQTPTAEAGHRGSPAFWKEMLDHDNGRCKALRLNLGHLGGLWKLGKSGATTDWPGYAISLLSRDYPSVYGDLADYEVVAHRTKQDANEDQRTMTAIGALLARPGNLGASDRLMYGTDWVMLSRSLAAKSFYPAMRDALPGRLEMTPAQRRGFLGGNAARFLGVAASRGSKPKTRLRLEEFYARRRLDPARLALWDDIAPTT